MPTQGVQYRAPHNIPDESLLGMVMTEPRPPRPNSIELRRSYPPEEQHLYSPPSSDHYRFVIFYNDREKCFSLFVSTYENLYRMLSLATYDFTV